MDPNVTKLSDIDGHPKKVGPQRSMHGQYRGKDSPFSTMKQGTQYISSGFVSNMIGLIEDLAARIEFGLVRSIIKDYLAKTIRGASSTKDCNIVFHM